jgi:hypothetical protein
MCHIVTEQTPTSHGKPLYGTEMDWSVMGALCSIFHFAALGTQDASAKVIKNNPTWGTKTGYIGNCTSSIYLKHKAERENKLEFRM